MYDWHSQELAQNDSSVVQKAVKGGGIVIKDKY